MDREQINQLNNDKGTVLVEFFASWCPHCQRMMPVVDDLRALFDGRANIYQFDIDENQELAGELGVESIPTFIVYREGKEMWRGSGEMDGNVIAGKIESNL